LMFAMFELMVFMRIRLAVMPLPLTRIPVKKSAI
jgi:hypothetical protein